MRLPNHIAFADLSMKLFGLSSFCNTSEVAVALGVCLAIAHNCSNSCPDHAGGAREAEHRGTAQKSKLKYVGDRFPVVRMPRAGSIIFPRLLS
jgi:hypothetical protein